jgi:hypothetical protein
MKTILSIAIALAILTWGVSLNINPAFAQMQCDPDAGSACWPSGPEQYPPGPTIQPAPAPIAGAGLVYLVAAGGYYAVRRWRKG